MVKQQVQEVCLDPKKPCARQYEERNTQERVTEDDFSLSITQMVLTGTVSSASPSYSWPDTPDDDDDAHELPDYEKLDKLDIVDKENYVEQFIQNPKNYENNKSEQPESENPANNGQSGEQAPEQGA